MPSFKSFQVRNSEVRYAKTVGRLYFLDPQPPGKRPYSES